MRKLLNKFQYLALGFAFALFLGAANTDIIDEIGGNVGYSAAAGQLLHVGNDNGMSSTLTGIFDYDGTASSLSLGTVSATITTGTAAGSDYIVTNGTPMWTLQGDVVDAIWAGDGTAGSDFILEESDGTDAFNFESDLVAFTFVGDASADSDFEIGDATNAVVLVETDLNNFLFVGDASADSDFSLSDDTNIDWLYESDGGTVTYGDAVNIVFNTSTGTKLGTATSQKIGFWNVTPIVQPSAMTAALTALTISSAASKDHLLQAITTSTPYGLADQAEAETFIEAVIELETRMAEVEVILETSGLVAAN